MIAHISLPRRQRGVVVCLHEELQLVAEHPGMRLLRYEVLQTVQADPDELSPLATSRWSEPEMGQDRGPGRPVSFSLLASTPADARGIADVGLIIMGGPAGSR